MQLREQSDLAVKDQSTMCSRTTGVCKEHDEPVSSDTLESV